VIIQGKEQIIPARIKSTDGFSNDVINITTPTSSDNNNFDIGATLNPTDLHIAVLRNQPPLFKIDIPRQTPLGIYTIPLVATIREPSLAALTKPISIPIKKRLTLSKTAEKYNEVKVLNPNPKYLINYTNQKATKIE
jgi:hypothetical protein